MMRSANGSLLHWRALVAFFVAGMTLVSQGCSELRLSCSGHKKRYRAIDGRMALYLPATWQHGACIEYLEGEVDLSTFQVLEEGKYAKDAKHVWYYNRLLKGADPATFEVIVHRYAKDEHGIFCGMYRMEVHDPERFEVVEPNKGQTVIMMVLRLDAGIDVPPELEHVPICFGWARDGVAYYFGPLEVKGADYETFEILENEEKMFPWRFYARDKYRVYYMGREVPGADPTTFVAISFNEGRDVRHFYIGWRRKGMRR